MKSNRLRTMAMVTALVSALATSAMSAQNKYTVKVPGGLGFAEFKGYEGWQVVSVSQGGPAMAVIVANSVMIDAYLKGIPGNGKPKPSRRAPRPTCHRRGTTPSADSRATRS